MRSRVPISARRRVARAFSIALGVAAAALALYLVVMNALIRTGKLSAMLSEAEPRLVVDVGASYSPWPGRVEARNLTIDYGDGNLHLIVHAPRGSFDVDLLALLGRRFRAENVTGAGYVVRLRPNLPQLSSARREALPEVKDFPKGEGPPPDPKALWAVELDDVDASLAEVWISEFRYLGESHLRGGFAYEPLRRVRIDPSELTLSGGAVHFGSEQSIFEDVRGTASAELARTDLPADVLRLVDARADVGGMVRDVRFVGVLWPELRGLRGGSGKLRFAAHAARGELSGAAEARYHAENLTIDRGDRALSLDADFSLDAEDGARVFSARAVAPRVEFRLDGKPVAQVRGGELRGNFTRDLGRPKLLRGSAVVERFAATDVRLFERLQLLPKQIGLSGGPVTGKVDVDADEKDIDAAVEVDLEGVSMQIAPFRGRAFGHAAGHWQSTRASPFEGTLKNAALSLRRVELESEDRRVEGWRLDVAVPELSLSRDPFRMRGAFSASTPDVSLPIRVAGVVPKPFDGLLPSRSVKVKGSLDLRDRFQSVTVEKTREGDLQVTGQLVARPRGTDAAFLVEGLLLDLGVRARPDGSSLKLGASPEWLKQELSTLPRR